jgi:putative ABC transport system permease protein
MYSDFEYEIGNTTVGSVVWLLFSIALVILSIAWINYVNITTSRAVQRAKEVGVRKAMGAHKSQLAAQFLTETTLVNITALAISIGSLFLLQPYISFLTGVTSGLHVFSHDIIWNIPAWLLGAMSFFLLVIALGAYPAFVLSRFKSSDVLKGKLSTKNDTNWLRKGLVIFQFASAVILITGTITIDRQIHFMQNQDLGAKIDNTVVLHGPSLTRFDSAFIPRFAAFKKSLLNVSGISSVTSSSRMFSERMGRLFQITSPMEPGRSDLTSSFLEVDFDFINHFQIKLEAGRSFDFTDHNPDWQLVNTVVINESAAQLLKFDSASQAIGQSIKFWNKSWRIVGVTADFHQRSLKESIEPIIFLPVYNPGNYISIAFEGDNTEEMMDAITSKYNEFYSGNSLDYFFLEDYFEASYATDKQLEKVSGIFTFLAILIAMLGLYGLVLMVLFRKTKEIGIRKVLGASLPNLLLLVIKDFAALITIAVGIGLPVSYLLLQEWMASYAYAEGIHWSVLLISAAILFGIAIVTIVLQTSRISSNNPVDSLKYE